MKSLLFMECYILDESLNAPVRSQLETQFTRHLQHPCILPALGRFAWGGERDTLLAVLRGNEAVREHLSATNLRYRSFSAFY